MGVSRREFATALGASAVTVTAVAQTSLPSAESTRAMLEAQGGLGVFADPEWLELLREGLSRNDATRRVLQAYNLSSDAEPVIAFARY